MEHFVFKIGRFLLIFKKMQVEKTKQTVEISIIERKYEFIKRDIPKNLLSEKRIPIF